jgi:hypothetical protein
MNAMNTNDSDDSDNMDEEKNELKHELFERFLLIFDQNDG